MNLNNLNYFSLQYRDSGVGDHGVTGIQTFLDDHTCGPVCKKLKLERLTADQQTPSSPRSEQENESEPED